MIRIPTNPVHRDQFLRGGNPDQFATPTSNFHSPGPTNVFIPGGGTNPEATGLIQVEFSRNPSRFPVNQYLQIVPDVASIGYYVELDTDEAIRVVNLEDFSWPDGNDAPDIGNRPLKWKKFATERRAYPFNLGSKTVRNATFDIVGAHARMSATQAMTARAYKALTVLQDASAWPDASKSATLDALGVTSGSWDTSATTDKFIEKSFHKVTEAILKNSAGVVEPSDLICIVNPTRAHAMRETAEIGAYIVNHESAVPAWMQTGIFASYGLPPQLYGINMVVDNTVRNSTRREATTQTRSFVMGDDEAVFVSRPGGLVGNDGPSFSTVTGFVYEDMTVEQFEDPENRRLKGRVVDDLDVVLTAPASGYHINDVTT